MRQRRPRYSRRRRGRRSRVSQNDPISRARAHRGGAKGFCGAVDIVAWGGGGVGSVLRRDAIKSVGVTVPEGGGRKGGPAVTAETHVCGRWGGVGGSSERVSAAPSAVPEPLAHCPGQGDRGYAAAKSARVPLSPLAPGP